VVAGRDEIHPGSEHLVRGLGRQAESGRRVLAVGDDRVDVVLLSREGEMFLENLAARRTDNVADDEDGEGGLRYDLALAFARFPVWTK
jgi:hypothetical protein